LSSNKESATTVFVEETVVVVPVTVKSGIVTAPVNVPPAVVTTVPVSLGIVIVLSAVGSVIVIVVSWASAVAPSKTIGLAPSNVTAPVKVPPVLAIALLGRDEYPNDVQAVEPSPILYLSVSVSTANSPIASVGLAAVHAEAVPRLN
jgi:hypothetical protein